VRNVTCILRELQSFFFEQNYMQLKYVMPNPIIYIISQKKRIIGLYADYYKVMGTEKKPQKGTMARPHNGLFKIML
jgi:hypothetical protein